ncbi:MAG: hypothetical protein WB660_29280 [Candidatus Sulfotelmatobacter sp.]
MRKNTALKFVLLGPLDSASAKVGDDVPLRLARPLVIEAVTLLPTDDVVHGRVAKVKQPTKCQGGEINVELNQVSFADSTTAKTKVFFVSPRPDANVEANYDSHFTPSDIPGVTAWALLTSPFYLLRPFGHHPCSLQSDYIKPANSTVAVRFTKDHRVRY